MSTALQALAAGWFEAAAPPAPLGAGRINDTLLVADAAGAQYVLQRINQRVFVDPARVMANVERVLAHLARRAPGWTAELVATRAGKSALVDDAGQWWRLWRHRADGHPPEGAIEAPVGRAAGAAFGRFQALLEDLRGPPLEPAIPGFLELGLYLDRLDAALAADRRLPAGIDPAQLAAGRELADRFLPVGEYIHGDCKLSNLLLAPDRAEVVCVLDLDTVMRGHWAWDFGDLARSVLVTEGVDARLFSAVVEGYTAGRGIARAPAELICAARYVTLMLGVRFLTDHLEGDRYFKVAARGDNLRRAGEQFALLTALESHSAELEDAAAQGLALAASFRA